MSHPGIEDPRHFSKIRLPPKTASLQPLTITEQRSTNDCRPVSQTTSLRQLRNFQGPALLHLLHSERLSPPKRLLLGKVDEWALRRTEPLDHRENRTPFFVQRHDFSVGPMPFPVYAAWRTKLSGEALSGAANQSRAAPFMVPNDVRVKLVITSL